MSNYVSGQSISYYVCFSITLSGKTIKYNNENLIEYELSGEDISGTGVYDGLSLSITNTYAGDEVIVVSNGITYKTYNFRLGSINYNSETGWLLSINKNIHNKTSINSYKSTFTEVSLGITQGLPLKIWLESNTGFIIDDGEITV